MTWRGVAAGALLALLGAVFAFRAASEMPDFEVYWRAGARAMAAEPLYRPDDEHYQLKYLPAFAVLAVPAALLPLGVAKGVWFAISAALIAVLLSLSLSLLPARKRPAWLLLATTFVAMAKFYGHELTLGQVNLLLATIVVGAVHLGMRGRTFVSGVLVALAVVIKPYAVIFIPWLAAQGLIRSFIAAARGVGGALVLPSLLYGVEGTVALHREWWRTVTESTAPNLLNADNVSLAAMYAKWMGAGPAAAWLAGTTSAVLLALAGVVFARRRRVPAPAGLEAGLLLTLIPLLSPQGWDYVFLVSTPAVMYLVNYERDLPRPLRVLTWLALAVVAFSLYDLMGRRVYSMFMAISAISVCFLAVVCALASLRLRRVA